MEIFLNLAWGALSLCIVCTWLHMGRSAGADRRHQIVAMAILIAILFPVISVSDDLMAAQNPAETDSCQRRDHLADSGAHALLAMVSALPPAIFQGVAFGFHRFSSPRDLPPRVAECPDLTAIQNRPPPAA